MRKTLPLLFCFYSVMSWAETESCGYFLSIDIPTIALVAPEPPPVIPLIPAPTVEVRVNLENFLVYFNYDDGQLTQKSQDTLQEMMNYLQQHPDITEILLEGHTDQQGSDAYNFFLGKQRAESVASYLQERLGENPILLRTESLGEHRLIREGTDEESMALNRRVEITLNRN